MTDHRCLLPIAAVACLILTPCSLARRPAFAEAKRVPFSQKAAPATNSNTADEIAPKAPFPEGDATAEGISEPALQELIKKACDTNSNALVVIKNGKLIGHWYFGHQIKAQTLRSITKSITSLAIGKLIDEHKISSVDVPLSSFFPEWKDGPRSLITLRNILTQTSGLDDKIDFTQPDLVKEALAAELKEKPGTKFVYNDRASNLLAGVVQAASGKSVDAYVAEKIFAPLAITDWHWDKDQAGQPLVMGGLYMNAVDLAKIGHLIVNGGLWEGKQIISPAWLTASTNRPSLNPAYGLMWWLENDSNAPGREIVGCMGRGHLGEALFILPRQKLIVVRLISARGHKTEADDFSDFPVLARALVETKTSQP